MGAVLTGGPVPPHSEPLQQVAALVPQTLVPHPAVQPQQNLMVQTMQDLKEEKKKGA